MEWEVSSFHREDFLAAQICQTVIQSVVKHPERIKLEPYIIKFITRPPIKRKMSAADRAAYNEQQKQHWAFILGGPVKHRKPPKAK